MLMEISNGIRFSISNLSAKTARTIPTIFQDRSGLSLYDAQWSTGTKAPIPTSTIDEVCRSFARFKSNCDDFGVPSTNVRLVATEATREAINSAELRETIKRRTGWDVELLPKEEEGRIGAMGIASSYTAVNGLVLDLGGGSVQMSWMNTSNGEVDVHWSTSLPYGAAALSRRLDEGARSSRLQQELETEVRDALTSAVKAMRAAVAQASGGCTTTTDFPIFLSGGGFRGWGHVLMDAHPISPYPIPIINGFSVSSSFFHDMPSIQAHIDASTAADDGIFRISTRRQSQLPAISFLIQQLVAAVPQASTVKFAQGGIREGLLFRELPREIRAMHPLAVATGAYAPGSARELLALLRKAVPEADGMLYCACPEHVLALLEPYANLLTYFSNLTKEARAAASLHSTTTGILASVHGVSHVERATLSLLLCQRWGGAVAPTDHTFLARLQELVGRETTWWCNYLGRVGLLVGSVYPAGRVVQERFGFEASVQKGKKGPEIVLRVRKSQDVSETVSMEEIEKVEKVGKKKNWVGGRDGWGVKVRVEVS